MKIKRCTHIYDGDKWIDTTMHYGVGKVNTLLYLLEPFRVGWELIGLIHSEQEYLGVSIGGFSLVSVFGKRHAPETHSDWIEKEQEQIDAGNLAIVLFYGTDNTSWMRRMTPEEYDKLELVTYQPKDIDLFYNS